MLPLEISKKVGRKTIKIVVDNSFRGDQPKAMTEQEFCAIIAEIRRELESTWDFDHMIYGALYKLITSNGVEPLSIDFCQYFQSVNLDK